MNISHTDTKYNTEQTIGTATAVTGGIACTLATIAVSTILLESAPIATTLPFIVTLGSACTPLLPLIAATFLLGVVLLGVGLVGCEIVKNKKHRALRTRLHDALNTSSTNVTRANNLEAQLAQTREQINEAQTRVDNANRRVNELEAHLQFIESQEGFFAFMIEKGMERAESRLSQSVIDSDEVEEIFRNLRELVANVDENKKDDLNEQINNLENVFFQKLYGMYREEIEQKNPFSVADLVENQERIQNLKNMSASIEDANVCIEELEHQLFKRVFQEFEEIERILTPEFITNKNLDEAENLINSLKRIATKITDETFREEINRKIADLESMLHDKFCDVCFNAYTPNDGSNAKQLLNCEMHATCRGCAGDGSCTMGCQNPVL